MSCRYPHYVHYYYLQRKVYQANAEDNREAVEELLEHYDHSQVQIIEVTTIDPEE